MQVVVYGATGRAGSCIVQELLRRGHEVTGGARSAELPRSSGVARWRTDDLSDVGHTAQVIRGADAVISAYAPPREATDELVGVCERLAEAVEQANVPRLLVVGGAGVLKVAPGITLIQSGKLPPEWVPIAVSHEKALAALRSTKIDWTYVSPAAMFEPGKRTGRYRVSKDTLLSDAEGRSQISMEDYAIALVDELEEPRHQRDSFAVAW